MFSDTIFYTFDFPAFAVSRDKFLSLMVRFLPIP
jgi:hypothetical protein